MMENTENQVVDNETPEVIETNNSENTTTTDEMTDSATQETDNQAAIWQDKYVRLSAEFDNYRKRTLKEKMELIDNGGADVLKAILSTADDFDRALAAMSESTDKEGVKLIRQKFIDTLKSKGVTEIEALGKPFDVDFHEAIAKVPASETMPSGMVIDVVQRGYMIKDKVLRFAKVVVAE